MSENKQIEEMALDIMRETGFGIEMSGNIAIGLYEQGYRKESEVIEEYRIKINSKIKKYSWFGKEYIQRIMREVQKEMVGDKNV